MVPDKDYFVVASDGEIDLTKPLDAKSKYFDFYYDIRICNSNIIVGNVNYRQWDDGRYCGNVGYNVKEDFRGNNYALKALKLLKDIIVKYGYSRMIISVDPTNIASQKTAEKFGANLLCNRMIPDGSPFYKINDQHQVVIFTYDANDVQSAVKKKSTDH